MPSGMARAIGRSEIATRGGAAGNPATRPARSRGLALGDAHVAAGRAATRSPGQQCLAEPAGALASLGAARAPPRAHPAGAVGRVGHRGAPDRGARRAANITSPSRTAVSTSTGMSRSVADPATASVRSRTRQVPIGASTLACASPAGSRSQSTRSGISSSRRRPTAARSRVPGDDRGHAAASAEMSSGTAELAPARSPAAGPQQPAVEPLLVDTGPGAAAACSSDRISRGAHRRVGENPQRDHVGGRELDHRTGLCPHPITGSTASRWPTASVSGGTEPAGRR